MGESIESVIVEQDSSRQFRVLFIHGFRQTAKGFHGRTRALQKRLNQWGMNNKDVTFHFEFAEGPHELPYRDGRTVGGPAGEAFRAVGANVFSRPSCSTNLKRGWLLTQEQYDEWRKRNSLSKKYLND